MSKNIVLLRGLTREQRHWENFPAELEKALNTKSVFTLDLPGFGDFYKQISPKKISEIAQLTLTNLVNDKRYNKDKKTSLIGLSLGGMVALEIASLKDSHDLFTDYIVINSSQKFKTPFYRRFDYKKSMTLLKGFLIESTYEREKKILELTTDKKFSAEVCERWTEYFNEKPFKLKSAVNQLYAGAHFSIENKEAISKSRGLVLCSKSDRLVDPICSQKISEITKWPIQYCEQGGHDLAYDEPEWLCNQIKSFLKTV